MAFVETRASGSRRILNGVCPVEVTLSEAVQCGDPLGVDTGTWVRSVDASSEQPLLIAGEDAPSGAIIKAYPMAIVEVVTTLANVSTLGEQVGLKDTGEYQVAASNLPDVGYSCYVGGDSLTAILMVFPLAAQLAYVRS